jgi:hypothetical protein
LVDQLAADLRTSFPDAPWDESPDLQYMRALAEA